MPWDERTAEGRIQRHLMEMPLETFEISEMVREMDFRAIPLRSGYVVNASHIYARVLGYHELLATSPDASEELHEKVLQFLHFHYRATDGVLASEDVLRVDFHGPRLHAVVVKPYGSSHEDARKRVRKAVAVAEMLSRVLDQAADEADIGRARLRVGIDEGRCLVVNNGSKGDRDPLFLGSPANHAAKLAAEPDIPGIYLTNRARILSGGNVKQSPIDSPPSRRKGINEWEASTELSHDELSEITEGAIDERRVTEAAQRVLASHKAFPTVNFSFHHHTPPLRSIKFEDLSPSNSIHMPILSLFADLDGFTHYVDQRMGSPIDLRNAARTLFVVRAELTDVLQQDFEGRKVRLIGDCVQGISAEGTSLNTDPAATTTAGVLCAAAMQSSFELIQRRMPDAQDLGLVIGLEFGQTPVTRLGIRGDQSVRVATSQSVTNAEAEQEAIDGTDIVAIGQIAYDEAPLSVQRLFDQYRQKQGLRYPQISTAFRGKDDVPPKHLATLAAPALVLSSGDPPRSHTC